MGHPVCFTCGESIGDPLRLNRLEDGRICPTCRDRVLADLPPIFPSRQVAAAEVDVAAVRERTEDPPRAS